MPIAHVSPSPALCEYSDHIEIDGYYTTVENTFVDHQHACVVIDLFSDIEQPRYVHSIEVPVARDRIVEVTRSVSPEWIKAIYEFQVLEDYQASLAHRLGASAVH